MGQPDMAGNGIDGQNCSKDQGKAERRGAGYAAGVARNTIQTTGTPDYWND